MCIGIAMGFDSPPHDYPNNVSQSNKLAMTIIILSLLAAVFAALTGGCLGHAASCLLGLCDNNGDEPEDAKL